MRKALVSALMLSSVFGAMPAHAAEDCPYLDLLTTMDNMAKITNGAGAKSLVQEGYCPSSGVVEMKEDRFSGYSTASTHLAAHKPVLLWSSEIPGRLSFIFAGASSSWKYLRCNAVYLLADGAHVQLFGQPQAGDVQEYGVAVTMPLASLAQIARAKTVEFKICNDEFVAPSCFLCEAKNLYAAVQAWQAKHP